LGNFRHIERRLFTRHYQRDTQNAAADRRVSHQILPREKCFRKKIEKALCDVACSKITLGNLVTFTVVVVVVAITYAVSSAVLQYVLSS